MRADFDRARVQAICFDIDGTIVDTDETYVLRLARWLHPLAAILPNEDVNSIARRLVMWGETPVNSIVALLDRLHLDQLLGPILNRLHQVRGIATQGHIALIPGAREALERLSQRYPLAVATARESAGAHAILRAHSLEQYFQCIATARTVLRSKPHPGPIRWVASQLNLMPYSLLMVGDTVVDVLAGRAAGAQTAALLCGFGDRKELENAEADVILHEPMDLVQLLL